MFRALAALVLARASVLAPAPTADVMAAALSATLQADTLTLSAGDEPFLLHEGDILRAPGGRVATDKTRARLKANPA